MNVKLEFDRLSARALKSILERKEYLEESIRNNEYDFKKSEDVERFKKYVLERATYYEKQYTKAFGNRECLKHYDRDGKCLQRRIEAVMNYAPKVLKYGSEFPLVNPPELLAEVNFVLTVNTIDRIHGAENDVILAAAIWILDELRLAGEIENAYPYLDFGEEFCESVELPKMIVPLYDEKLIKSLVVLIRNRNCDEEGFKTGGGLVDDAAASRYCDLNNKQDINEGSKEAMSMRNRFDAIINLIPSDKRRYSRSNFEARLKGIFKAILWSASYYQAPRINLAREIIDVLDNQFVNHNRIVELNKKLSDRKNTAILNMMPPARSFGTAMDFQPIEDKDYDEMESYITENEEYIATHDELSDELMEYEKKVLNIPLYTTSLAEKCVPEDCIYDRVVTEKLEVNPVVDPYEICFAYVYLLDSGSDLPWLYNVSSVLLQKAVSQLPWIYTLANEKDYTDLKCTPLKAKKNDGAYKEMYLASLPSRVICGRRGPTNEVMLNLPQILFLLTGVVTPRKMFSNTSRLDFLFDMATGESGAKLLKAYTELAYAASHSYAFPQEEKIDNSKELQAEIEKYAKKNRELKADSEKIFTLLNESRQEANSLKKKLSANEEKLSASENEIKRLREEVEKLQNRETKPPAKLEIAYPYTLRHRTVILGGCEQWANLMRDYLPGCKIFHVDKKADANVVRECEVIWIYSKEVTHSQFKKIMNLARKHNKTVKYFSYKGAEKCAEQAVLSDMEDNIE